LRSHGGTFAAVGAAARDERPLRRGQGDSVRVGSRECEDGEVGKKQHPQTFADIVGRLDPVVGEPNPDAGTWPSPMADRQWFDDAGKSWHMRGDALDAKRTRRLLAQPNVRLLHCYGMHPHEVSGAEGQALLARVEQFFDGDAPPMSTFDLAEFRDEDRAVMVVVEESC